MLFLFALYICIYVCNHIAWVRGVRNVVLGTDYGCDSCPLLVHSCTVPPPAVLLPASVVMGGWQALFDYSCGLGCEVGMDAWVDMRRM